MGLIIEVKVVPNSGKKQWKLDKAGTLKCYLKSPPERGLANKELIASISKLSKIPRENIAIIAGKTSRKKVIKIDAPITLKKFLALVGIEEQLRLY